MSDVILAISNVSKSFRATQALKNVNFTVRKGTIHSLLGRNGAGKSTVVNIIAGIHKQNTGDVLLEGKDITSLSVSERQKLGIKIVPQHASIAPDLTIAENIFMGIWPLKSKGLLDWKKLYKDAKVELDKYGLDVDPKQKVKKLNLVNQRKINIIKAMYGGAKLIILDEPTTALTTVEREELFQFVNELKAKGTAFIFISHYLQEVVSLSDEITVIRDGISFDGSENGEFSEERLANLIAGEDVELSVRSKQEFTSLNKDEVVLECKNISGAILKNVSVKFYKGEIVGLVGFPGSGARELCRTLYGLEKRFEGEIIDHEDKPLKIKHPTDAMNRGIMYLSSDRHKEGIVGLMTIVDNISTPLLYTTLRNKFGLLNKNKANEISGYYFRLLDIKANSILDKLSSLSGGNQQKVVVAKTICNNPSVLMLDEPTIGIDIKSREDIIKNINQISIDKKTSVLYLTNDYDELIRIVDRIIFFQDGKLMKDIENVDLTHEDIIAIRDAVSNKRN